MEAPSPELERALAAQLFDRENDQRQAAPRGPLAHLAGLTATELADLRAPLCPECKSRDCDAIGCDRCGRHAENVVMVREQPRVVCARCLEFRHCASCDVRLQRWQMASVDGELFCAACVHYDPTEQW